MTIALGFVYQEGWILAADSSETVSDYSKKTTDKIRLVEINEDWRLVFSAAGHGGYADMLQSRIENACTRVKDFDFDIAEKIIAAEVFALHNKHLWPVKQDSPSLQNLILVQRKKETWPVWDAMRMFKTSDTSVSQVEHYHAIGIGSHMADYLAGLCLRFVLMSPQAAECSAAYMLKEIKESILGCDGKSLVCFFSVRGSFHFMTNKELSRLEASFDSLNRAYQKLFEICSEPEDPAFEAALRKCDSVVAEVRREQLAVFQDRPKPTRRS